MLVTLPSSLETIYGMLYASPKAHIAITKAKLSAACPYTPVVLFYPRGQRYTWLFIMFLSRH